jgi:hypothetical protein
MKMPKLWAIGDRGITDYASVACSHSYARAAYFADGGAGDREVLVVVAHRDAHLADTSDARIGYRDPVVVILEGDAVVAEVFLIDTVLR